MKFVAVKFVVFFSFWQGIILGILESAGVIRDLQTGWSSENIASLIQSFMVCFEMVLASFLHMKAFSHKEFSLGDDAKTYIWHAFKNALNPIDIYNDIVSAPKEIQVQQQRKKSKMWARKLKDYNDAFDDKIQMLDLKTDNQEDLFELEYRKNRATLFERL